MDISIAFRHLPRIDMRAGVGTLLASKWLPGLQWAGPSAPLDEELLISLPERLNTISKISYLEICIG